MRHDLVVCDCPEMVVSNQFTPAKVHTTRECPGHAADLLLYGQAYWSKPDGSGGSDQRLMP